MRIGLAGKKGSGKDTAAKALIDMGYTKLSFAESLRDICIVSLRQPVENFYKEELKEVLFDKPIVLSNEHIKRLIIACNKHEIVTLNQAKEILKRGLGKELRNPREALQFIGTELIRDCINQNYLANILIQKMKGLNKVVITDVRFPNERQLLRMENTQLGLIIRDVGQNLASLHKSENSLGEIEEYDFILYNDGCIKDLQNNLIRTIGADNVII